MASQVSNSALRMIDGRQLILTAAQPSGVAAFLGSDSDNCAAKNAYVVQFHVNGQEVDVLVRVTDTPGGRFVDLIADQSVAALSTTVAAMNLSPPALGHPNPAKDYIDKQALVAAGGS